MRGLQIEVAHRAVEVVGRVLGVETNRNGVVIDGKRVQTQVAEFAGAVGVRRVVLRVQRYYLGQVFSSRGVVAAPHVPNGAREIQTKLQLLKRERVAAVLVVPHDLLCRVAKRNGLGVVAVLALLFGQLEELAQLLQQASVVRVAHRTAGGHFDGSRRTKWCHFGTTPPFFNTAAALPRNDADAGVRGGGAFFLSSKLFAKATTPIISRP